MNPTTLTRPEKNQRETAVITGNRPARPRRLTSTLLWSAQILLAAFFLFVAVPGKLIGDHGAVQEFAAIGAGQWFRVVVGIIELAGAIGLLVPGLAGLAAAWLAADMLGATITNVTALRNTTYADNAIMTAILFAMFVLLVYGRRQQIKPLAAAVRRLTARRPAVEART